MVSVTRPLRVFITGASGFIGTHLAKSFRPEGHRVQPLVRRPARGPDEVAWDPARGHLDPGALEGADVVVHLAGEPIAQRWTARRKKAIKESRVKGTRLLAEAVARLEHPPRVLLCASAVGYYGERGDRPVTEDTGRGDGFLAEVCEAWEAAAQPARDAGIRVVHMRSGLVLGPDGGVLGRMLTPFKLGLGGPVGSGNQFWSWITIDDWIRAFEHAVATPKLAGPVNFVSPEPTTSREFAHALGRALHRPAVLPAPSLGVKLAFGKMADELLLQSANVIPAKLVAAGFTHAHTDLEPALRHVLQT